MAGMVVSFHPAYRQENRAQGKLKKVAKGQGSVKREGVTRSTQLRDVTVKSSQAEETQHISSAPRSSGYPADTYKFPSQNSGAEY
jgi:hypothetical protein